MSEQYRVNVHYLEAVTALLQRVRKAHPTKGLYEAADLQWWWRTPRSTDNLDQLFWFDNCGLPEAAVIATAWDDHIALTPIVMPDATPDWVAHVIERGLAHASESGFGAIELEVDRAITFCVRYWSAMASRSRKTDWSRRGWLQTLDQRCARFTGIIDCPVASTRCCVRTTW